jgi:putative transposase
MPISDTLKSPFLPNNYYHIVFKAVDEIRLFKQARDHNIFLERFNFFTADFIDTWAYCMLNNHVHFIVKVKSKEEIIKNVLAIVDEKRTLSMQKFLTNSNEEIFLDEMIERQMNRFMVSYVNLYKRNYNHHGGMFQSPFKRLAIHDESYLQQAIIYVHANTVKHNLPYNFKDYECCSYKKIVSSNETDVTYKAVIEFFGGKEKFELLHEEQVNYYYKNGFPTSKLE